MKKRKEKNKESWMNKRYVVRIKMLGLIALVIALLLIQLSMALKDVRITSTDIKYSEFMDKLNEGEVVTVTIYDQADYFTTLTSDGTSLKVPNPKYPEFKKDLMLKGATVETQKKTVNQAIMDFVSSLPLICFALIIAVYLMNILTSITDDIFKRAKKETTVMFADVAGLSEAKNEIAFVVDALKNSAKIEENGARGVKGIMLYGPPGTGKTMIAKAIAGEAGVPFICASGSDFSAMYVGVGAQRVRQLCKMAAQNAPCVVFIDEIDALAKKRSYDSGANTEFSGTLNALLQRMDGMNSASGVLFVAATNMLDVIDSALLRPGRFDRQIFIGPPTNRSDREAIMKVHLKNKNLAVGLSVDSISKFFVGMTGAQIEGVLNEAVLESMRADREGIISITDIDSAAIKMQAQGVLSHRFSDKERDIAAVHEAGHAVMSVLTGRKVSKVSIVSYGKLGGHTQVDYEEDDITKAIYLKNELIDIVKIKYGGLCAEELIFGQHSSGCADDLKQASHIIEEMIKSYGMGNSPISIGHNASLKSETGVISQEISDMSNQIKKDTLEALRGNVDKIEELRSELMENDVVYNYVADSES